MLPTDIENYVSESMDLQWFISSNELKLFGS